MTCQRCRHEASVHLTESIDGEHRELHLCATCARESGVAVAAAPPPDLKLDAVVDALILANVGELVGELAQKACPECGLRYMEFRETGRLGCPHDYELFAPGLVKLLRRAHGATRHVGKQPLRSPAAPRADRIQLRSQLREAVACEDYERAARLRDQLRLKDPHA
jgi:protein arginine kinase activator